MDRVQGFPHPFYGRRDHVRSTASKLLPENLADSNNPKSFLHKHLSVRHSYHPGFHTAESLHEDVS
jgi:hypothetical protein